MEGRGTRGIAAAALVAALAAGTAPAAAAATFTVTSTDDSTSPCAGTVCPSLRSAVAAANASGGGTIQLGGGTYRLGSAPNQPVGSGELKVTGAVTIAGAGATATTIQQVDAEHRVIEVGAGGNLTPG